MGRAKGGSHEITLIASNILFFHELLCGILRASLIPHHLAPIRNPCTTLHRNLGGAGLEAPFSHKADSDSNDRASMRRQLLS